MIVTTTGDFPSIILGAGDRTIALTHPQTYDLLGESSLWDQDDLTEFQSQVDAAIASGAITATSPSGGAMTMVNSASMADHLVDPDPHPQYQNLPRRDMILAGGRWYSRTGRFYGPNVSVGPSYPYWNSSLGANPNYTAMGLPVPFRCKILKAKIYFRKNNATNVYTGHIKRHTKNFGTNAVVNTQAATPLIMPGDSTTAFYRAEWIIDPSVIFEEDDMILPLLEGSQTAIRYLFSTIKIIVEKVP